MNCIFPPELTDLQIMAYLDDPETNPETASHLQQCPYCQEKTNSLELFQNGLKTRLYRSTCPSSEELGEYYLRMSPANQRLVIAQHLRECPLCSSEVSSLERFWSELGPAASLFQPVRVIIARLMSGPDASAPFISTLRGEMNGPLIFEAEDIVITLDVQPGSKGQASMQGQVAADDQDQWTGATVHMLQPDMRESIAVLDDLGAFRFEGVRSGAIQLKITSPGGIEVQISSIDINV